ncbi:MAG: PilZ domain-containing protein [Desulfobacteraceae bacterium]|nr:MAG: PilZ domain-containing protein [Desulfobacteraceae bacterium]
MKKRCRERIPLRLAATIESKDRSVNVLTRDISSVGAYFDSENNIPVGSEVELEVYLPLKELKELKGGRARMKVGGTVVRVEEGGVAVLFRGVRLLLSEKDGE